MDLALANQANKRPSWLIGIWIVMVAATLLAISVEDQFFQPKGQPVASIEVFNKEVTYRGEEDVKWRQVSRQQGFYDGDRIATGLNSSAKVNFGEGRFVEISQDTLIAISSIKAASGNSFVINLLKGAIKPTVPAKAKHSLMVISGDSSFTVEPGEQKGFTKPVGGGVREFNAKEKFPVRITKKPVETEKLILPSTFTAPTKLITAELNTYSATIVPEPVVPPPPPPVAAPVVPIVKPAPPKLPEVEEKPAQYETLYAKVVPSSVPKVLMASSYESFASGYKLQVKLEKPQTKLPEKWQAGLVIQSGAAKKLVLQDEVSVADELSIVITPSMVQAAGTAEAVSGVPCSVLTLNGVGQVRTKKGKPIVVTSKDVVPLKVCLISEAKSKLPLVVGLEGFSTPLRSANSVIIPKKFGSSNIQVLINQRDDLDRLAPYILGSEGFQLASAKSASETGVFVVRSGKTIAQLAGKGLTPEVARQAMNVLSGNLVFKGKRSSLYDARKLKGEEFKKWLDTNSTNGRAVYIYYNETLMPVSRGFLEERPEVADFVRTIADTIFLERVKIVAFK